MSNWKQKVDSLRQSRDAAVMVSVDSIVGSTPREPGAKMIVTLNSQFGTIGGGNLEYQAAQIARNQLTSGSANGLQRFPLGAGLGQCCGGLVNLMFESLNQCSNWDEIASEPEKLVLYLFGAGHVGTAVVNAMRDLPVFIHWVDTRDKMLPEKLPMAVNPVLTDTPEVEVDEALAGAYFLVMTHDHGLDQRLAEQILKRDDFSYFGLIGSHSKRRNFETRMSRRGIDPQRFSTMTCPIGINGIHSKQPAQIAISVAAEILQVYDRLQNSQKYSNHNNDTLVYGLEGTK
jgi:xanthine dehydrogenase accessory factor